MKVLLLAILLLNIQHSYSQDADLATLSDSGFIIGPGTAKYPINSAWTKANDLMPNVTTWDGIVKRIEKVVCGKNQNKSVILVGDATTAYRYIFAKIALRTNAADSPCKNNMQHVEIDVNKIEAGHSYVGQVQKYWEDNVYTPAANKNAVLYFSNLEQLIGLGSHEGDKDGIETEYVNGIKSGALRTVAYLDKYQYNSLVGADTAYVAHAFAETIMLPAVSVKDMESFISSYLTTFYPRLTLQKKDADYFFRAVGYYQPNKSEPDRSLAVLESLILNVVGEETTTNTALKYETNHPYPNGTIWEKIVQIDDADKLSLVFDQFNTDRLDMLEIYDNKTMKLLLTLGGNRGHFETPVFKTNQLKLVFKSDASVNAYGFIVESVNEFRTHTKYTFTHDDVRTAILTAAQVPRWLIDRNYQMIKDLPSKLDGDVVGVNEGKTDAIRLIETGYITGRTDEKPIGTLLFAGPTGTGKSYLPKRLADFLNMNLVTLDMTSYKDPYSISQFVKIFSRHLINNPYAIYLFEEIDKASIEVLDQLYFLMDEGIFYDPYQRPISARGALIIMTTNAASDVILRERNNPNLPSMVAGELQKSFRSSFLNRFDAVSIFYPFTDAEYVKLAEIMSNKKIDGMKKFLDWTVTVDKGTIDYIASHGKSTLYGARPMERLVETVLSTGMAKYQIQKTAIPEGAKIEIKKTTKSEHSFKIVVNGKDEFDFEVVFKQLGNFAPTSLIEENFRNFFQRIKAY